jgi:serralysin
MGTDCNTSRYDDNIGHDIHACIDMKLPKELVVEAAERAIAENPDNDPARRKGMVPITEPLQLALLTGTKWQNGRTLRVRFLDGDSSVHQKVATYAKEWEKYANIKLQFGNDPNAEIRISFNQQGSWSYLGTDNLSIPRNQPTMNYGWLRANTAENQYYVVFHEFGHALGCIHEHQNPAGGIQWNKEAAYRYYGQQGWSRQMVDQQVFQQYSTNQTQFTETDATSIMMYPVPRQLTLNGFEAGVNTQLSATDKRFIAQMYPGSVVTPPVDEDWKKVVQNAIDMLAKLLN